MKPLMQGILKQQEQFTGRMVRLTVRSLWIVAKEFSQQLIVIAGLLYLWSCFGTGQPHRYLSLHEAYAVFDQAMHGIQEKGCPR
jgi:hypothetical protein